MVKEVKFLVCVNVEEDGWREVFFTYKPYYYCLTKERTNPEVPYSQEKSITTIESGFDEMVDLIARDWTILQIGKNEDYIPGLSWCTPVPVVFPTKESMKSFKEIINQVLSEKFDSNFVDERKIVSAQFLFNLSVDVNEESCKLVSSDIGEYEIKRTIEDDLDYEIGSKTKKIPTKTSTIRFIVKTIPRLTEDPFDTFAFAYNRYYLSRFKDEIHDTPIMFLEEQNEFACCGWAVEDWFHLQLIQSKNYILGLGLDESLITIVHTERTFDEIIDKLQEEVGKRFDNEFIRSFDNKSHAFLFEFEVSYNFDEVKLLSSKMTDILETEEPSLKNIPVPRGKLLDCLPKDFNREDL